MSMNPHSKEITGFVFYIMSEIYWYGRNWELIVVYEKQVVNILKYCSKVISRNMVHKFCRQVGFKVKYIKIPYIYEARCLFGVPKFFKHIS